MSRTSEPRHGLPESARRDGWGLDKYTWPDGLQLAIYDDGRIKIGRWGSSVAVFDVSNYRPGKSRGSAFIIARFTDATPQDQQP